MNSAIASPHDDRAALKTLDGRVKDCPHADRLRRVTVAKLGGHRHNRLIRVAQCRRGRPDCLPKLVRALPYLERDRERLAGAMCSLDIGTADVQCDQRSMISNDCIAHGSIDSLLIGKLAIRIEYHRLAGLYQAV